MKNESNSSTVSKVTGTSHQYLSFEILFLFRDTLNSFVLHVVQSFTFQRTDSDALSCIHWNYTHIYTYAPKTFFVWCCSKPVLPLGTFYVIERKQWFKQIFPLGYSSEGQCLLCGLILCNLPKPVIFCHLYSEDTCSPWTHAGFWWGVALRDQPTSNSMHLWSVLVLTYFYRPHIRSMGKVMFLLCVSVHREGAPVPVVPDFATRCQQVRWGAWSSVRSSRGGLVPCQVQGWSPSPRSGGQGAVPYMWACGGRPPPPPLQIIFRKRR